jgi:hypothetical protein
MLSKQLSQIVAGTKWGLMPASKLSFQRAVPCKVAKKLNVPL